MASFCSFLVRVLSYCRASVLAEGGASAVIVSEQPPSQSADSIETMQHAGRRSMSKTLSLADFPLAMGTAHGLYIA